MVLPNGTFMLQSPLSRQAALLDLATLTWTETGTATKNDRNDEEGWTLLPNGKVLTVDVYTDDQPQMNNSEVYDPLTGTWSSAGSTIVSLANDGEIGPAVLRPDGTVFATSSYLTGNTAIYNSNTNTWSVGPPLPSVSGVPLGIPDGPAALLPNGNVLLAACPAGSAPTYIYEFDGTNYTSQPGTRETAALPSGNFNMLVLPTGQIFMTTFPTSISTLLLIRVIIHCGRQLLRQLLQRLLRGVPM